MSFEQGPREAREYVTKGPHQIHVTIVTRFTGADDQEHVERVELGPVEGVLLAHAGEGKTEESAGIGAMCVGHPDTVYEMLVALLVDRLREEDDELSQAFARILETPDSFRLQMAISNAHILAGMRRALRKWENEHDGKAPGEGVVGG